MAAQDSYILQKLHFLNVSSGFSGGRVLKNLPASAGDAEDMSSNPGSGRSPEEEMYLPKNGNLHNIRTQSYDS